MSEPVDKRKLFQKFIANQCTSAEREKVWDFIEASQIPAEFEAVIRDNIEHWIAEQPKVSPEVSSRMLKNIRAGIDAPNRKGREKTGHPYAGVLPWPLPLVCYFWED